MPTLEAYRGGYYLWLYVPSLAASVTFAVLYGLVTTAHAWKTAKTKTWFCLLFVIGGISEELGYITRAVAYNSTGSLAVYILQATFLLLPPVFFAASMYMVYSRLVRRLRCDSLSPISPRWTTRFFVLGDLVTLNIQSSGAGLMASQKTAKMGNYIVVAGLVFQVVLFAGFMWCCLAFFSRFRAHLAATGAASKVPWKSCLHMLFWTSLAVLVRNIFRVAEYVMGKRGYLQREEWPMFVFDSVLMLLVMIAFYVWYPAGLQPNEGDPVIELASDRANSAEHAHAKKPAGPSS